MKTITLLVTAVVGAGFAMLASPAFAGWTVVENDPDPFEPSKSTFIAGTIEQDGGFAIRCLQGGISLVVASGSSNATPGQLAHLKIVADGQPPRDENNSVVMGVTNDSTAVQFGDETTLNYLNGAQKVSVRYWLGDVVTTRTFDGGAPFASAIQKALKACGK
jgi:hypothetical protein